MLRSCFIFLLLLGSSGLLRAQVNLRDSCVGAHIVNIDLGIGLPAGDLADRFGPHATVGGGYQHKWKNNFLFGVNGSFIYGSNVKEDSIINNLENEDGFIVGSDGLQYSPILWESGFDAKLQAGVITKWLSINPNSGITFLGGVGFLQHNIWIYIDETAVPQLASDYKKGYDRLSNGWMLNQYIGYYLFSNKYFVNFRGGLEVQEAFTQNRRTVNYDTGLPDDTKRFDMMMTLKLSWNLPMFEAPRRKYYTY